MFVFDLKSQHIGRNPEDDDVIEISFEKNGRTSPIGMRIREHQLGPLQFRGRTIEAAMKVSSVAENGLAEGRILVGDIILDVNGVRGDYNKMLEELRGSTTLKLVVRRAKGQQKSQSSMKTSDKQGMVRKPSSILGKFNGGNTNGTFSSSSTGIDTG